MKTIIKITFTYLALIVVQIGYAQWTRMADFPNDSVCFSGSFTIGNKAYLVSGKKFSINFQNFHQATVFSNEVWEFDMGTELWSKKANFPDSGREFTLSFALNGKGYFGGGQNEVYHRYNDIWEYDPVNDSWLQKTTFPGSTYLSCGFTINNKGYVLDDYNNIWEYDPIPNTWLQRSIMPGLTSRRFPVAIEFNNKGYVGFGAHVGVDFSTFGIQDFYEYDPLADTWSILPTLGVGRYGAGAFTLNNSIYIVGGNGTATFNQIAASNAVFKYTPSTGLWSNAKNFGGGPIQNHVVVSNGSSVYAGTGYFASFVGNDRFFPHKDWWKYSETLASVDELEENNANVALYPNPVKDELTIHLKNQQAFTTAKLKVLSVDGKIIYETMVSSSIMSHSIDLSSFTSGMYIVELKSDEFFYTKKIIKE